MISVVIPTLNAEAGLPATLSALVPAAADGLVREVVVADAGSTDLTSVIADAMGCNIVTGARGRGAQLSAGADVARAEWLLFLHADTVLGAGWEREASSFMEAVDRGTIPASAGVFRFALDSFATRARLLEGLVAMRCALFALPYGDQGLLIPRRFYRALGGYKPMPLMEDVDLVQRIGRGRLHFLRTKAVTSAVRYESAGYLSRSLRNLSCLAMYYVGVSPATIAKRYEA